MELDDPRWDGMQGGYRVPYDPREALAKLESGNDASNAWKELWTELHHQGDVGEASYAAVSHLVRIHAAKSAVDWNTYAIVAVIEDARRKSGRNPELPAHLRPAYEAAWQQLVALGLEQLGAATDSTLIRAIISVIAMGKGQFTLGHLAISFAEDELQEMLDRADKA